MAPKSTRQTSLISLKNDRDFDFDLDLWKLFLPIDKSYWSHLSGMKNTNQEQFSVCSYECLFGKRQKYLEFTYGYGLLGELPTFTLQDEIIFMNFSFLFPCTTNRTKGLPIKYQAKCLNRKMKLCSQLFMQHCLVF